MSVDALKPLDQVLTPDSRWTQGYNLILEEHHAGIAEFELHTQVPEEVRQHFENARNTWLYAFFEYRLLSVSLLMLLVSCEAALKFRAKQEKRFKKNDGFQKLMNTAISERWLLDAHFSATLKIQAWRWERDRETAIDMDQPDPGPWKPSEDAQTIARWAAWFFPKLRNEAAHGGTFLHPNASRHFRVVSELINQLFPPP
ncbi:hypothetical protein [Leptothrix ochracea]|uniref:hypothetical protein n=1 Tax=Leptothrix ochracea TaxID=735331 RepID=UPI0034E2E77F